MGLQSPLRIDLIDGDALRRDLTALAHANSDSAKLRKLALAHIKTVFNDARGLVKARVDDGQMQGLAAAHALSAIQDTLLQVLYDFATKHFYYAQNPTQAERMAIVATGGYGRGQMRRSPMSICYSSGLTKKRPGARASSNSSCICCGTLG